MTRGAAISMALLAIIVLVLIVLLAWPTHSASESPVDTDAGPAWSIFEFRKPISRRAFIEVIDRSRNASPLGRRNAAGQYRPPQRLPLSARLGAYLELL
jgi:hypothetical protein